MFDIKATSKLNFIEGSNLEPPIKNELGGGAGGGNREGWEREWPWLQLFFSC